MENLKLGNISIEVFKKDIKNIHLSVYPPEGSVRISAPERMEMDTIRVFALSKLRWIKEQQEKFRQQEREAPRDYLNMESHYYNGQRYLMEIHESPGPMKVELSANKMHVYVRPGTNTDRIKTLVDEWYRSQLKDRIPKLIEKWEPNIGVTVRDFGVKKMKTKWGTCNSEAARIWLNLELAKKPPLCLEYIVVHEMIHILEPTHNKRFRTIMNYHMPNWKQHRDELNRLPVSHGDWGY